MPMMLIALLRACIARIGVRIVWNIQQTKKKHLKNAIKIDLIPINSGNCRRAPNLLNKLQLSIFAFGTSFSSFFCRLIQFHFFLIHVIFFSREISLDRRTQIPVVFFTNRFQFIWAKFTIFVMASVDVSHATKFARAHALQSKWNIAGAKITPSLRCTVSCVGR